MHSGSRKPVYRSNQSGFLGDALQSVTLPSCAQHEKKTPKDWKLKGKKNNTKRGLFIITHKLDSAKLYMEYFKLILFKSACKRQKGKRAAIMSY